MALFGWADDDARKTHKHGAGWHIAEKTTRGGDWQHRPESYDYFRHIPRLCQAANSLAAYTSPLRHKREILICLRNSLQKQKQIVQETQTEHENKQQIQQADKTLNIINKSLSLLTDPRKGEHSSLLSKETQSSSAPHLSQAPHASFRACSNRSLGLRGGVKMARKMGIDTV